SDNSDEINPPPLEKFTINHGRLFLNDPEANYMLPSDKEALEGEALGHLTRRYLWGGNYSSPIEDKLLNDYPSSTFVGVDINPDVLPSDNQRPSNVGFIECNVILGIPFPSNTFDFVFMCGMWGALTLSQWPQLIKEIVRVLKYGGWIELLE
ncbi:12776_t:CDS:2, partial [Racocetra fulgida]